MSFPKGVREGPFAVFKGWDWPGHDVANYPNHNIDTLKDITLNSVDFQVSAFNSGGWMKSGTVIDHTQWKQVSGSDLYVRVDYPGFVFLQGVDSNGNDIQLSPANVRKDAAGLINYTRNVLPPNLRPNVAGFNTNGWIKNKITSNLVHWSDFIIEGIYVRTHFPGWGFFPHVDAPGNDIQHDSADANNIPALIAKSNSINGVAGFNTNGWIKKNVLGLKNESTFGDPRHGTYIRNIT